tara:strand:- start:62 stop:691 length:630 start_codon:yes stop_codon:yes gene_type:complete
LSSYLFVSNLFLDKNPILYLGWTLEWEIFFYSLFAFSIFLKNENLKIFFLITAIFLATIIFSSSLIGLEFILGILIARIYHTYIKVKHPQLLLIIGLILLSASIFVNLNIDRFFTWGIPCALIVCACLYIKQTSNKLLIYLGNASYSIYLLQVFTIPAFYKIASIAKLPITNDILAFTCIVGTVVAGSIFYALIEKPSHTYLKGLLRRE